MRAFADKVRAAVTHPVGAGASRAFAIEFAWLAPLLTGLSYFGGYLHWAPVTDIAGLAGLALFLFFAPALGEELVFRIALLAPPPRSLAPLRLIGAIALFVAWHPLQILVWTPPWADLAFNPCFLASAAALALATARLYHATGSLWPPVALHWVIAFTWKALLGG